MTSPAFVQPAGEDGSPKLWRPTVSLFRYTPESNAELSRTPLIAIYGDGSVIVRGTENEQHLPISPLYLIGQLRVEQQIELYARQANGRIL